MKSFANYANYTGKIFYMLFKKHVNCNKIKLQFILQKSVVYENISDDLLDNS